MTRKRDPKRDGIRTSSGVPITEKLIDELSAEAKRGYEPEKLRKEDDHRLAPGHPRSSRFGLTHSCGGRLESARRTRKPPRATWSDAPCAHSLRTDMKSKGEISGETAEQDDERISVAVGKANAVFSVARRPGGRGGGPAAAAGADFQARLAAWLACAILAETDATPLWDWPESETFETVHAETDTAVDDLHVTNSAGCHAYIQVKFRVQLSEGEDSPFASALSQFVRQFIELDRSPKDCDRLVLATSSEASSRIRDQLPRILRRARDLAVDEPLAASARGAQEAQVLRIVCAHLAREWQAVTGSAPRDADLRQVLSPMRVSIHDLYEDGSELREALAWLRTSVLKDQGEAGGVWRQLISLAAEFSVLQTGADRRWLQERLTQLGVVLRGTPSYRSDINMLLSHSRLTIERLADFGVIRGHDGRAVKVQRTAAEHLRRAIERDPVVVTGDPGAGKSATLFELATALDEVTDVVVLAADTLAAGSLGSLRNELGLEHEVVDVLCNWPGVQPAYLFIDALDAARGERAQEALLDLIRSTAALANRWVIVASVRRFDLRYNQDLQTQFASGLSSAPDEFQVAEFASLSHFNIPLLSDEELGQLERPAPHVHAVISRSTPELGQLVRTPFNLRLLAELVSLNVATAELEPISTQMQLLDKYWQHRVLSADAGGDALEAVLRVACEEMITSRTMRVDRSSVQQDPSYAAPLRELLSNRVLLEEERAGPARREVLAFSHHVLFDYAASRLLLRGTEEAVVRRTAEQPELLLTVRPSYDLHFRYLWELAQDRHAFWSFTFRLAAEDRIPQIGKIIGSGVAALQVARSADAGVLLAALGAEDKSRVNAELVLRHLIAARLAEGSLGEAIPPDRRTVWCEIALSLSEHLRAETAYPIRNLLLELCTKPERFNVEQLRCAGLASRNLFDWACETESRDRFMLGTTLKAVVRTFASDPDVSERLLRRVLATDRLRDYGFIEMPELADEVPRLMTHSPGLVRDIYSTAFEFKEESEERTQMTSGVLNLTSYRRQDFEMAHYVLAEAFPKFLRESSKDAIDALAAIQRAYSRKKGTRDPGAATMRIDWLGELVLIEPDGGYVWDLSSVEHDEEVRILNEFERWLIEEVEAEGQSAAERIVEWIRSASRPASIWRRTLVAAERAPESFFDVLEPLLSAPAALASVDLSSLAGDVLIQTFPLSSEDGRRRIEDAILGLPNAVATANERVAPVRNHGEHIRDRLLGCLPDEMLVTDDARARLLELRNDDAVPENRPPVAPLEWSSREWGERDELAERRVDVDAEPNHRLQQLQEPVRAFATRYVNDAAPPAELAAIEQPLNALWAALHTAERDGVAPEQADYGWGHVSAAADAVSRGVSITPDSDVFRLATEILLAAASHRLPAGRPDTSQFDEFPSWGSPAPRVDAAGGLLCVGFHPDAVSEDVVRALETLSVDAAPEVRLRIAQRIALLRRSIPDVMWRIAERTLRSESSTAVLATLMTSLPRMTLPNDTDRLERHARALFERGRAERPGASKLRETCIETLTDLYIWRGHEGAGHFLRNNVISALRTKPDDAEHIVRRLREPLTYGDVAADDTGQAAIRARAVELSTLLLKASIEATRAQLDKARDREQLADDDPLVIRARTTAQIIDRISAETYFASGAFDEKQGKEPRTDGAQRERSIARLLRSRLTERRALSECDTSRSGNA